ncbi:MAG: tryptophan--tRNA ligase [Planctomycetota bacterium]|nr:tryptophan--tRNA ligase [Planctomycetota bacterium]MDA1106660.1 tryptophan--tRNA ligase [Planctomycetota bacterium]
MSASGTPIGTSSGKPRILTGDTPTGSLHLGHWVGSVRRRVEIQPSHECYFLLANMHAFTTRTEDSASIRADTIEIVRDYLAMGIDPQQSAIVLQSEVPAIAELTFLFAMLLPFNRVMRNPTLKTEIELKGMGDKFAFGFPLYAVGQTADILAFRAVSVPVGEDQVPHLELTREVARRFNQVFCGVPTDIEDHEHEQHGGVFPVPVADVGRVGRLMGTDGKNKMSKSLNNAIAIADSAKDVQKKVNKIFTGRQSPTEPGDTSNALFQFVECFIPDAARVAELKDRYARGDNIGDGHIKAEVAEAINALLAPMRERRAQFEGPGSDQRIIDIIMDGTRRANRLCEETLLMAKAAAGLKFWPRQLQLG